jgi:hypothetical protein
VDRLLGKVTSTLAQTSSLNAGSPIDTLYGVFREPCTDAMTNPADTTREIT